MFLSVIYIIILHVWQASSEYRTPCQSSLGLRYNSDDTYLHLSVSHGNPIDIRLDSPHAWRLNLSPLDDNIVQINSSRDLLLTGLQLQGHEDDQGWVTGFKLETSTDCKKFHIQNYDIDVPTRGDSLLVQLKALTLATCARLIPTSTFGTTPAIRLDLIGCYVSSPNAPPSIRSLTDGSWELSSWTVQVISSVELTMLEDHLTKFSLAYSRDCDLWRFIDQKHFIQVNVPMPSDDNGRRLVVLMLYSPVKAKCVRVFSSQPFHITESDFKQSYGNSVNSEIPETPKIELESMNRLSTMDDSPMVIPLIPDYLTSNTSQDGLNDLVNHTADIDLININTTQTDDNFNHTLNDIGTKDEQGPLLKVIYFDDTLTQVEYQSPNAPNVFSQGIQCGVRSTKARPMSARRKRIVSGTRNRPGEWPWLVSLHYLPPVNFTERSGYKHLCGASLITDDWLLTAGHCLKDNNLVTGLENVSNWEVLLGAHDQAMQGDQSKLQRRKIQGFVIHPGYMNSSSPSLSDLALVRLDSPVNYSNFVSPVCLDEANSSLAYDNCAVSGWGQLSYTGAGSRYPYTAPKRLMSQSECNSTIEALEDDHPFKKFVHISEDIICAVGPNGEDSCLGDSGSPLVCERSGRWYQVGVVSAGYECGHPQFPAIYTSVPVFLDWIRDTIVNYDPTN